ncbi:hypothetical protein [Nostoc sp. PA-18-2419]|uniref:hypothetical protein n=1 Tax=Nostoc sp. PA-18-2419 TaxID=2575443 RepID=UPI0011088906|nr:hypothetical protein [Nostoc sp. PA-18-2419]
MNASCYNVGNLHNALALVNTQQWDIFLFVSRLVKRTLSKKMQLGDIKTNQRSQNPKYFCEVLYNSK